jgi:hypothetical protein
MHVCHLSYDRKPKNRRVTIQVSPGRKPDPISKTTRAKRAGGLVQVEECLSFALSSNPNTTKKMIL